MTTLHLHVRLAAGQDEVWPVVGNFGRLDRWHPLVPNCRLLDDGITRVIKAGGTRVVEVLDPDATAEDAHTYRIERSPIPVRDYRATLSVRDEGSRGCTVMIQSSFQPVSGVPEPLVLGLFWGFFKLCFWSLEQRYGAQ
ncbi:MAG: SRPBCC family protein [Myxococcota bacterium]